MASVVIAGDVSGTCTLQAANAAGTTVLNLPTTSGTLVATGGAPSFTTVTTGLGNATAPAYSFTGDTNTGIFSPTADTIAFTEGGAEAMRIDASGNVGIGTSSPTNKLSLATTVNGGICLNVASRPHFGATYSSDSLVLGYSVKPNPSTVDGMVGTETNSGGGAPAAILMNSGVIQFHTATSVTSGAAFSSERMRILSTGTVLVGKTAVADGTSGLTFYGGAAGSIGLGTTGSAGTNQLEFFRGTEGSLTRVGSVQTTGSATSYNTSSDYRLKENIAPMTGALATVAALKPVTYTWKVDGSNGQGFIAHELQAIVPDCVTGEKDAVDADGNIKPQGIDTSFLVATLTAAIQELKAVVDAQAVEIAALKTKVGA